MSIYQKYKANRIWDIDFRTGSFKDRSGNYNMVKNGSQNITKNGFPGITATWISATISRNIDNFTYIFSVDFANPSGASERIINGANFYIYFVAGRATLAIVSGTIVETISLTAAQYGRGIKTFAITANNGSMVWYLDGVQIGVDDYAPSTTACALQYINGNSAAEGLSGIHRYQIWYNTALTASEISVLTDELNQQPETMPWSKAVADGAGNGEVNFKGELAAIANETTIASGYLENTPYQITSGSFKMITEKNSGKIEKVIENVTNGFIYKSDMNVSSKWSFYLNKSSAVVASTGFYIISSTNSYLTFNGYRVQITGEGYLFMYKFAAGIPTGLYTVASVVFSFNVWNKLVIERSGLGVFNIYINDVLITSVTDNTYTTSTFSMINLGQGDKLIYASENERRSLYQLA